jgi:hypothetical protein
MPDEGWLIAQLKRLYRERPEEVTEEEIRRRIDKSDVVFGVWQAAEKPGGIDRLILSGDALFAEFMDGRSIHIKNLAVVPCQSFEDALRTKRMFGTSDV